MGIGDTPIARFENDGFVFRRFNPYAAREVLEGAGVEFIAENGGGAGVRLKERTMNEGPIYADASRSAVLQRGVTAINCYTLQEAVIAFENLPKDRQEIASITSLGRTYSPSEIRRLHYGPPKPASS